MSLESFSATATEAVSVVQVGGTFRVTHQFRPAPESPHLYEVQVSVENLSAQPVELRYRRVIDWDAPDPLFADLVTIQGTQQDSAVLYAGNDGFAPADPFGPRAHPDSPVTPAVSGDFVDFGPLDQGALFDFGFGVLAAGATHSFTLYFGAAPTEADALAALGAAGARVYSLGQSGSAPTGLTFIFGYKGGSEARLECEPESVIRGDTISCSVLGTGIQVQRWEFAGAWPVVDSSGVQVWSGPVAVGGRVIASVRFAGRDSILSDSFTVNPRSWRWGPDQWSFKPGEAPITVDQEPQIGVPTRFGWNCTLGAYGGGDSLAVCLYGKRVLPEPEHEPNAGYTLLAIPIGPNSGMWYVSSVSYHMARGSNINPQMLPTGTQRLLPEGSQAKDCRKKMNLGAGTPVNVYFYTFNANCKGLNMAAFIDGLWQHEGFGSNGSNGHESQARRCAAQLANDPYAAVEDVVFAAEAAARPEVIARVGPSQDRVTDECGSPEPTGNWSGRPWMWSPAVGAYERVTIDRRAMF